MDSNDDSDVFLADKSALIEFLENNGGIYSDDEYDAFSDIDDDSLYDDSSPDEFIYVAPATTDGTTTRPPPNGLNPLSDEQNAAIQHIIQGANLILDSVSGSGKSTCVLNLAHLMPHKRILQLTYNSDLRLDVKKKIKQLGLNNIVVHTFHSLAVKYYDRHAITDNGIRRILYNNIEPQEALPKIDILVLDESQDMTFLYYQFMVKFSLNMGNPFQLFILGDYKQCLYQFKGADARYLTLAQQIWETHPLLTSREFYYCKLKTSYRITRQIASFLNETMLGEQRMVAVKDGPPVIYIRNTRHNAEKTIIYYIKTLLQNGYTPNDIFVLAPSVKTAGSNIRKMENYLVEHGIPAHVPMFETDKIDKRVMEGKVVFSTFHSVKGRERKIVIVVGFDQSYFRFYGTNIDVAECPNTLYVATTRPQYQLVVIENNQNATDRPLVFLKQNHHEMKKQAYIDFKGTAQSIFYTKTPEAEAEYAAREKVHDVTPTGLIQFIPETTIDKITPIIDRIWIRETPEPEPAHEIPIPAMIKTRKNGLYEDVSDLNGIAIPSIYYDYISRTKKEDSAQDNVGANILLQIIDQCLEDTKPHEYAFLKKIVQDLPTECNTPRDYLYLSNVFIAVKEKLYYKLKQISEDDYNWLTQSTINWCLERLNNVIGKECEGTRPGESTLIEYPIVQFSMLEENRAINHVLRHHFQCENVSFRFSARTDLITVKTIWEIKCTSTVSLEHKLQTIIYAWIWKILHPDDERQTKILNIKTGEIWRLDASLEELTEIMVELLKGKYNETEINTDDEFVLECLDYLETIKSKNA